MRTIRIEQEVKQAVDQTVRVSTEAIVADDADAEEAGRDARRALDDFVSGWAEGGGD